MTRRALLLLLPLLAACSDPTVNAPGAPTVRHFASTRTYGDDAVWHVFVFKPEKARSLDERLALAQAAVHQDGDCRWVRADRDEILAKTADQGTRYRDILLAAPLRCRG